MDQLSKVANPSRGQLNREKEYSPASCSRPRIWSREKGSAVPSCVTVACSFSIPTLNLVLTDDIPPDFRGGVHLSIYIDQPVKAANPARGQLNRENEYFPVPVRTMVQFGLARQGRPSRPASACSFTTLRMNVVFPLGIPPDFRGA